MIEFLINDLTLKRQNQSIEYLTDDHDRCKSLVTYEDYSSQPKITQIYNKRLLK